MKQQLALYTFIVAALGSPISFADHQSHEHKHEHHDHHGAHQHGVAHINLSIEDKKVELELQGALANFISFEYVPQSEAELQEVKKMVKVISDIHNLFILSKNAECTSDVIGISSDIISDQLLNNSATQQPAETHSSQSTHGNLSINIEWSCRYPEKLNQLDATLFKSFPNLEHVEVQMITPKGQRSAELSSKETTIQW